MSLKVSSTNFFLSDQPSSIPYTIEILRDPQQLESFPKELGSDYRFKWKNSDEALSSFSGLGLDSQHTTSQVFLIKENQNIIGSAMLLCEPYKFFSENRYIIQEKGRFFISSFLDINDLCNPNSFHIEFGWFQLLPSYRNKGIAKYFLYETLIPTIKNLSEERTNDIYVSCRANGTYNISLSLKKQLMNLQKNQEIFISSSLLKQLGETHIDAQFTTHMASQIGILRKENVYDFSLGPVLISALSDVSKQFLLKK